MTLTQILAAVFANHKRDDRETVARTAIELAIEEATKLFDWEQLQQSTDTDVTEGDSYIGLPSDYLKIKEVRVLNDEDSWSILIKNRELLVRDYPDADSTLTGRTKWAYVQGTQLFFVPRISIDATIRVTYHCLPSFSADDQEMSPTIHGFDQYLIQYATAEVFNSLQLFKEGQYWLSRAAQTLGSARVFDQRNGADNRIREDVQVFNREYMNPEDPFAGMETSHGS